MFVFVKRLMTYKHIEVVPYNPDWTEQFKKETAKIKQALDDNCIKIHHIGSTSIPKMPAKPIIDILPVVKDICLVEQAFLVMHKLSYETNKVLFLIPFRRFFSKGKDIRTPNVHIFEENAPEIDCHLKYRDWLRKYPNDRNAYAKLKQDLAKKFFGDINSYYNGKEEFILNIGAKAGWDKTRMVGLYTNKELEVTKNLRQKYIFDPLKLKDPYLWTFEHEDHIHFVFYKGTQIIGYAHIELRPENRAALRIITIDENYRNNGYGKEYLNLCEKWLRLQKYKSLYIKSSPKAYSFFKKCDYIEMNFNYLNNYKSDK